MSAGNGFIREEKRQAVRWNFPRRNREQERLEKAEINTRWKRNCSYGRNSRLVRTTERSASRTSEDVDHSWRSGAEKRAQALGDGQIQRLLPPAAPARTRRHGREDHRWVPTESVALVRRISSCILVFLGVSFSEETQTLRRAPVWKQHKALITTSFPLAQIHAQSSCRTPVKALYCVVLCFVN